MFKKYPDVLTIPQVAEALGIGKKAAYDLVNRHLLACVRIGKIIKVPKYALVEFMGTARNNVKL